MRKLRTMHLFAGAGGGILGDLLLGHQPVCAVEINEYCQQVLSARQEDGCLPWFPIFADVTKFDGVPWRGIVDVVAGGFPCQDISAAGKGAGIDGARSGLWREMARIIGEVRPRYVFVENSPLLVGRGLVRVLADLAEMGFDAQWGIVGADDVGAPHRRERLWLVANADSKYGRPGTGRENREETGNLGQAIPDVNGHQHQSEPHTRRGQREAERKQELPCNANSAGLAQREGQRCDYGEELAATLGTDWWESEPDVGRNIDGLVHRLDEPKQHEPC